MAQVWEEYGCKKQTVFNIFYSISCIYENDTLFSESRFFPEFGQCLVSFSPDSQRSTVNALYYATLLLYMQISNTACASIWIGLIMISEYPGTLSHLIILILGILLYTQEEHQPIFQHHNFLLKNIDTDTESKNQYWSGSSYNYLSYSDCVFRGWETLLQTCSIS